MDTPGERIVVAALAPDDWQRSRDIRLRALREVPDAFWAQIIEEEKFTEAQWRERLDRPSSTTFVASRDGEDVGCVVGAQHHADDTVAGLYSMYVAREARGQGVGEALVQAVLDWARERGYPVVRFDVGDWNEPAQQLYARMGAVPTGRHDHFPDPRDHITEHELEIRLS